VQSDYSPDESYTKKKPAHNKAPKKCLEINRKKQKKSTVLPSVPTALAATPVSTPVFTPITAGANFAMGRKFSPPRSQSRRHITQLPPIVSPAPISTQTLDQLVEFLSMFPFSPPSTTANLSAVNEITGYHTFVVNVS